MVGNDYNFMEKLKNLNTISKDYELYQVDNSNEALDFLFHKNKHGEKSTSPYPDLILLDINLEDMQSLTLHKKLLLDPETRKIPILFLVSNDAPENLVKAIKTGADEFVAKTTELKSLNAKIQVILKRQLQYLDIPRTDPLTKIYNRQTIEIEVTRELKRLRRYKDIASLIYIDFDGFKELNKQYDRTMGDFVLLRFADILRKQTREIDLLGRYGGEEFVIFCPQTDAKNSMIAANRILAKFQELSFGLKKLNLSLSAGISEAPKDGEDFQTLCSKAYNTIKNTDKAKGQILIWK